MKFKVNGKIMNLNENTFRNMINNSIKKVIKEEFDYGHEYLIPLWAVPALANGDPVENDEDEANLREFEKMLVSEYGHAFISFPPDAEKFFSPYNDITGQEGSEVMRGYINKQENVYENKITESKIKNITQNTIKKILNEMVENKLEKVKQALLQKGIEVDDSGMQKKPILGGQQVLYAKINENAYFEIDNTGVFFYIGDIGFSMYEGEQLASWAIAERIAEIKNMM